MEILDIIARIFVSIPCGFIPACGCFYIIYQGNKSWTKEEKESYRKEFISRIIFTACLGVMLLALTLWTFFEASDKIIEKVFPLVFPVAVVEVLALNTDGIKIQKVQEEEERQKRMKKVIVENFQDVGDTVSKSDVAVLTMNGHIGFGATNPKSENVINHYVYLRDKQGCLMQFKASANAYAALNYKKGSEITVEMFSDRCIWNGMALKDKIIIEKVRK